MHNTVVEGRVNGYVREIVIVMTTWVTSATAMTGAMERSGWQDRQMTRVPHTGIMARNHGGGAGHLLAVGSVLTNRLMKSPPLVTNKLLVGHHQRCLKRICGNS